MNFRSPNSSHSDISPPRGPPTTEEQPIPSNPIMKAFFAVFLVVAAAVASDNNSAPEPAEDFDSAPAGEVTRGPAVAAVPVK